MCVLVLIDEGNLHFDGLFFSLALLQSGGKLAVIHFVLLINGSSRKWNCNALMSWPTPDLLHCFGDKLCLVWVWSMLCCMQKKACLKVTLKTRDMIYSEFWSRSKSPANFFPLWASSNEDREGVTFLLDSAGEIWVCVQYCKLAYCSRCLWDDALTHKKL